MAGEVGPNLVTFDIENMANLLWSWQVWGQNWNSIATELEWFPICIGYKSTKDKKAKCISLWDYPGWKPVIVRHKNGSFTVNPPDISRLMQDTWDIIQEADCLLGWNSKRFDIKKLNACFLDLGMKPYKKTPHIDLMQEKKKLALSNSNKLDDTARKWGVGRKTDHEGWELWMKCIEGDKKAQRDMVRYCKRDVEITEKTYTEVLRPWISNHPSIGIMMGRPASCDNCGNNRFQINKSKYYTKSGYKMQYKCSNCGAYKTSPVQHRVEELDERLGYDDII